MVSLHLYNGRTLVTYRHSYLLLTDSVIVLLCYARYMYAYFSSVFEGTDDVTGLQCADYERASPGSYALPSGIYVPCYTTFTCKLRKLRAGTSYSYSWIIVSRLPIDVYINDHVISQRMQKHFTAIMWPIDHLVPMSPHNGPLCRKTIINYPVQNPRATSLHNVKYM